MPQWYPAAPRRPFRERTTKLWITLVAGLVCLLIGLGAGIAIGHAIGHHDRGPGRFERFPGRGPGFSHRHGPGFGGRNGVPHLPSPVPPKSPQASPGTTG
jgi:hypothetical protein